MASTEPAVAANVSTEPADPDTKTIFNLLSNLKGSESVTPLYDEDILIFKRDPATNQNTINKTAYLKLHRSLSPGRNSTIEKIKGNYEKPEPAEESVETLKAKYSPSGLGYAKLSQPVPKPRRSKLTRSQIILPSKREQTKARLSLHLEKNKNKDVNSNEVLDRKSDGSSEEEFVSIVTRSDSDESVSKFEKELSAFTMDKKKRSNSFRKIFSVFSNKDKKKKHKNETSVNGDNLQNMNQANAFNREAPHRHTTGGEPKLQKPFQSPSLDQDVAQLQISEFDRCKQSLENILKSPPTNGYAQSRPIYQNNDPYMNIPNIRKYIDTSSSASTLESDRSNIYQNESLARSSQPTDDEVEIRTYQTNSFRPGRISDGRRDTPPRLLETKQDVRLVNPKALIPINSERPLPNPYQNLREDFRAKPLQQSTPKSPQPRPYMEDGYGTVLDSVDRRGLKEPLEASKLRLPPNREIVPLSPRVKSPIPMDNVSTDKLIATELLKPKRSPTPTKQAAPSHQRLEIDIDYPESLVGKPPASSKSPVRSQASRSSNESVVLRPKAPEKPAKITTDVQVHMNSPLNRTATPNQSMSGQNLSLSPIRPTNLSLRPATPTGSQMPDSPKTTPQKEDIRKSVEAYYWKEIKKLKDKENYELYMLQMHYGHLQPYGYAEDPANGRRSRSMSPLAGRNGTRRSLSLPRESRAAPSSVMPENYYPSAIPENRAVINRAQPRSVQQLQFQQQQQQYFQRNAPGRSTIDSSPRRLDSNTNSLYRPIFKRGSLSTPPSQIEDPLKRKVSFSGAQTVQAWPTKNGFTQSPPQRRLEKPQSAGDDDVFLPSRPNEELYYNTRAEPMYVLRPNPNNLYLHQRQLSERYGGRGNQSVSPKYEEALYGQPIDAVRPAGQQQEEIYVPRRVSYQGAAPRGADEQQYTIRRPPSQQMVRREVIVSDGIFGQFGGYSAPRNNIRLVSPQSVYSSRQSVAEQNSRIRDEYYLRQPPRQVSVSNKVCDFYGQIHDADKVQSGVLMGQLQPAPGSPAVLRNAHSQMTGQENFVRNSRLTASANDMYRRVPFQGYPAETLYGRIELNGAPHGAPLGAPNRPLPPVPLKKQSDESGSDASEVQRILKSSKTRQPAKKRGVFGK
ncbi:hypothetical protein HUJ04_005794 [Dendroctonus ponderosae]|uniref:WH2 domain-containing protein n=1 Tax=Dendroctonus ponderosae TaxID=77166 RepID=A0AAR5PFX9_DENPD|nr:hypothetical protein HUJ04_005794 [Dendroctonus ponderosae]KAH1001829.1 hypothetical protein HUJ04_005794 [Dendroctonus ponderosae]KAH1001830.1 hypothetical protein HUJ04_005794 [Dendroctonus ponderosae]